MAKEAGSKPWTERAGTDEGDPDENKYPHNKKIVFQGGVEINVGNETGKQYIKLHHPSGTYMTIWPDGKMETHVRGENREYHKGGVTITIDENQDIHINGHSKMHVGGGAHIEVSGDAGIVCGGDVALSALSGSIGMQCANFYLGCTGNMNLNVGGDTNIQTGGSTYIGSGSTITEQAGKIQLNPNGGGSGYRSAQTTGPSGGIVGGAKR